MAFGAAYDAAFGVAILAALEPSAALLRLDVPEDPFYLRLNGVFLLMLAACYAVAAREPLRYRPIVRIAIAGRIAGFALFAGVGVARGLPTFVALGVADLAFALAHLALMRRAARLASTQVQETQGT